MMHYKFKIPFLIVGATLLLGVMSCGSEADISQPNDMEQEDHTHKQITYNLEIPESETWKQLSTRGAIAEDGGDLADGGIAVTANLQDGSAYFSKQRLSFSQGNWDTSSKYYWPTENLDFYARYPMTLTDENAITEDDTKTFKFSLPSDATRQNDLMYAVSYNLGKENSAVELYMYHALAAMTFYGKAKDNTFSVTVKGIELHNVATSATFIYPSVNTTEEYNGRDGLWSNLSSQTEVMKVGVVETTLSAQETLDITATNGKLMLIPQKNDKWNRGDDDHPLTSENQTGSFLVISCKLMKNGRYYAGSDDTYGNIYVPFDVNVKAGEHHVYTLEFGMGYNEDGSENAKVEITLTANITGWNSQNIAFDKKIL